MLVSCQDLLQRQRNDPTGHQNLFEARKFKMETIHASEWCVQKSDNFQFMDGGNILAPRIMRMEEETVSFQFEIRYMYI